MDEESSVKKDMKQKKENLHIKTKEVIEGLSEEEALKIVEQKWIAPLVKDLEDISSAIIIDVIGKMEYLAEKFFISPYYLSHQFRRVTGFSLINYIQITRVRNAQQLLLYTDMKIADITTSCGFTSFSQFNRVFNKFCHTSPSQFRVNGVVTPITAIPYEKEPSPGSTKV